MTTSKQENRIDAIAEQVDYLVNRAAIEDVIKRYARALDWLRPELMDSAIADDAEIDFGFFKGNGTDFKPYILKISAESRRRWHFTSQVSIKIDREFADVESYHFAVALDGVTPSDNETITQFYGFYIDRMEKRAGEWIIIRRKHLLVSGAFIKESGMEGEYALLNQIGSTEGRNPNFRPL